MLSSRMNIGDHRRKNLVYRLQKNRFVGDQRSNNGVDSHIVSASVNAERDPIGLDHEELHEADAEHRCRKRPDFTVDPELLQVRPARYHWGEAPRKADQENEYASRTHNLGGQVT